MRAHQQQLHSSTTTASRSTPQYKERPDVTGHSYLLVGQADTMIVCSYYLQEHIGIWNASAQLAAVTLPARMDCLVAVGCLLLQVLPLPPVLALIALQGIPDLLILVVKHAARLLP